MAYVISAYVVAVVLISILFIHTYYNYRKNVKLLNKLEKKRENKKLAK